MNKALLQSNVQNFIRENLDKDLSRIILAGSPFPNVSIQEIATQISGLQKARKKIPSWFNQKGIIFPPNLNLEQSSSEITATYKASLISGEVIIDLTGGLGIDSCFFAERFEKVIHCELNAELSNLASYNFRTLGKNNIATYYGDSLEFLKTSFLNPTWIFIDPARRDGHGGKVFMLEQCTPNIKEHLDFLFQKTDNILIKTSPLLDLKATIQDLGNVTEIHIIAVNNEVKELLWLLTSNSQNKPILKTVNFQGKNFRKIQEFASPSWEDSPIAELSFPKDYLYEPNAAVMKSGLFNQVASQTSTCKLHPNSHLYTSEDLLEFPGRRFYVLKIMPFNKKILKKELTFSKANITTRNFPKSVADLRRELKMEDGGDKYIFFTTNLSNEKIVLLCSKI